MSCGEVDNLRNQGKRPHDLPASAQQHLRDCEACADLQAIWEGPAPGEEIPEEIRQKIIRGVVAQLHPVTPLIADRFLIARFLFLAATCITAGALCLGQQGWRAFAPWQASVIYPLAIGGIFMMTRVVTRQMVPGAAQPVSSASAILVISGVLLTGMLLLFPYSKDPRFISKGLKCWELGLLWAAVAGTLFALVLRRGAWLSPVAQGTAAGFLSGLVGLTVLEIYCPNLDRAHRAFFHLGAAMTAVLLGIAFGVLADLWRRRREDRLAPTPNLLPE